MTETKYSGIASIGEIPAHWRTYRIKSLLSLRSEKNSGDHDLLSVYLDRGVSLTMIPMVCKSISRVPTCQIIKMSMLGTLY